MSQRGTRGVGLVALLGVLGAGASCELNEATGRRQLTLGGLSRSEELRLGAEAAPQLTAEFGGAVADAAAAGYMAEIGRALAVHTEGDYPGIPWEFTLLDSPVFNAFALPGGKVFLSRGLAEAMTNEAQLAAVVGHEIGHVTARHTSERVAQGGLAQVLLQGAAVGVSRAAGDPGTAQAAGVVLNMGGQGVLLKFGRDQESEADALGMRYMTKAGYNPRGALELMRILERSGGGSAGGALGEFFATHPYPETRIERISALLAGEYAQAAADPARTLGQDRYRSRMLDRLARLPSPRAAVGVGPADAAAWCAHCASELAAATPAR
ncbi:MAG: peptidase M48 Ste24p [Planctomyces sp.]|nr:peptidase M48 Ste24p [Planctomyces sp.]MBA4119506.1 peptidase M48 Ste24p [Isosphaera sp.]